MEWLLKERRTPRAVLLTHCFLSATSTRCVKSSLPPDTRKTGAAFTPNQKNRQGQRKGKRQEDNRANTGLAMTASNFTGLLCIMSIPEKTATMEAIRESDERGEKGIEGNYGSNGIFFLCANEFSFEHLLPDSNSCMLSKLSRA